MSKTYENHKMSTQINEYEYYDEFVFYFSSKTIHNVYNVCMHKFVVTYYFISFFFNITPWL